LTSKPLTLASPLVSKSFELDTAFELETNTSQELSPMSSDESQVDEVFFGGLIPLVQNTCGRLEDLLCERLCALGQNNHIQGINVPPVRGELVSGLIASGVSDGMEIAFSKLSDYQKMLILEYAACTQQSYAPGMTNRHALYLYPDADHWDIDSRVFDHVRSDLFHAYAKLKHMQRLSHRDEFRNLTLQSFQHQLRTEGYQMNPLGNMIYSSGGVVARLFYRQDATEDEVLIAFPGLGALGLSDDQVIKRQDTVWENFIPLRRDNLYQQAQSLTDTVSKILKDHWAGAYGKPLNITVSGHSLGGGFAMVAANCESVDQAIAFQAYAPVASKISKNAREKTLEINIKNDEVIPSIMSHWAKSRKVICETSAVLPVKVYTSHNHIYPQLMSNFVG